MEDTEVPVGREAEPVDSSWGTEQRALEAASLEKRGPVDSALGRRAESSGGLVGEAGSGLECGGLMA